MKLLLLPKQSNIMLTIIVHFTILVYPVDEAIFKNDGALAIITYEFYVAIMILCKIELLVDFNILYNYQDYIF